MKVAFYVNNSQFPDVDCRNVIEGNPGVGGTWHMVMIVASQLALRPNNIDVTLYAQYDGLLPDGPDISFVANQEQAILDADKSGFDYIVLNYGGFNWSRFDFKKISSKLQIIVWCHNFCNLRDLDLFSRESKVAKIITVSREQMDLYRDHSAFEKTDYIFNCVPYPDEIKESVTNAAFDKRGNNVVYLASLVPEKSFHVLASIWPIVLKCVPDAQLYVIGNGSLYSQNAKLGKYQIAENAYEARFMKYLTDSHGEIIPSVHFMGKMGKEKYDVILKSKVGVPNPTGNTETFCISAVEMQYGGCSVTAMSSPGYLDTFVNGIIVSSKSNLVKSIVHLLTSSVAPKSYAEVSQALENKFGIDVVVDQWESFLLNITDSKHIHSIEPIVNGRFRYKWLKERLRILKLKHSLLSFLPSVEFFLDIKESIMKKIKLLAHLE